MAGSILFVRWKRTLQTRFTSSPWRRIGLAPLLRRWGGEKGWAGPLLASTPLVARRSPLAAGSKVRAAHRSPLSPAITHTWRCAEWQGPPPAERVRLPSRTQLQPPHKLHTPQPAPGCVAHKHTQWALLMAGEAAPQLPHGTRTACSCAAAARGRGFSRDPACPQPHNCMAHPAPHKTRQRHMHRHLRRPHRVAYTPVPSPLYPLAPLPTHGSKHAVQGRLATPQTPPSIIHPCVPVRTVTSL